MKVQNLLIDIFSAKQKEMNVKMHIFRSVKYLYEPDFAIISKKINLSVFDKSCEGKDWKLSSLYLSKRNCLSESK